MKSIFLMLPVFWVCITYCQAQESVDLQMMQKIRDEEKSSSQIEKIAYHLTDVCGPRLTNSPGYHLALDWVTEFSKSLGLENAGREAWGEFGKGWSNEKARLSLVSPYYENIIAYPVPWTKGTGGTIRGEVIMLNNLDSTSIDSVGNSIRGKFVMLTPLQFTIPAAFEAESSRYADTTLNHIPDNSMITSDVMGKVMRYLKKFYDAGLYLEEKGAKGLIIGNKKSKDGTVYTIGISGLTRTHGETLPEMDISRESILKIARLLMDKKKVQLEMEIENKSCDDDLTGYNFIAEITGTDTNLKEEVVMLGAHLDSWTASTGAADNAAGCAVMLEAMRILKALHVQPRRTIRLALWGGEEERCLGSLGYVKKHFGNPADMKLKPEQSKISAYYNLDNGSGKIRGIYLQNNDRVAEIFRAWFAPFSNLGATGISRSNTGGTDHLSFDAVGIPAFQFIQDELDYETRRLHTNMDSYDHLNFDDLKQSAVIVAAFAYNTAMRNDMLPRKPLPPAKEFIYERDFP